MKLTSIALLLLLPVSAATIGLVPSNSDPAVGETFTVEVQATDVFAGLPGEELILFGFDVEVDDEVLVAFIGGTMGPLFLEAGLAGADVSGFPVAFSLMEGDFTEPLLLATLSFERLAKGPASIRVTASPDTNPDHGLFYLGTVLPIDASAKIGAVPEPSSLGLIAAGTLALWATRRSWRSR
jgi:hypothetical protein